MKKAALITRSHVQNCGSFLQTLATLRWLENEGVKTTLIRYIRTDELPKRGWNLRFQDSRSNPMLVLAYRLLKQPDVEQSFRNFERFRNSFFPQTRQISSYSALKDISKDFDFFVAGGDQLWGEIGYGHCIDPAYFLTFTDRPKISFSSSFGTKKVFEDFSPEIKQYLMSFSGITVRENSSKVMLEKIGVRNVSVVGDPVTLFSKEEWLSFENNRFVNKGPFVLLYDIHANRELGRWASEYSKLLGLPLISASTSGIQPYSIGTKIRITSPFDFISLINKSSLVITNSFHASLFSLILNKDFFACSPGKTSIRITDLLKTFSLPSRLVTDFNDFEKADHINWPVVNRTISALKNDSEQILKSLLKSI